MKLLVEAWLTVLLFSTSVHIVKSQPPNMRNSGMRPGEMRSNSNTPQIEPSKMVGIMILDSEKIIKKVKIKDRDLKTKTYDVIRLHNTKMNGILSDNKQFFNQMKLAFMTAVNSRDSEMMKEVRKLYMPNIIEIKLETKDLNNGLKEQVSIGLNEKQARKWDKYFEQMISEVSLPLPNNRSNQSFQNGIRTGGMRRF